MNYAVFVLLSWKTQIMLFGNVQNILPKDLLLYLNYFKKAKTLPPYSIENILKFPYKNNYFHF